tara:strand:+ start:175 stop:579 length:405 start_codon:yes stop_codon:yes gene_type:complete
MFCKICFDNNSNLYDTHNLKNNTGIIVCPTLLNYKCPLCFQFGHTIRFCNKNKNKNKNKNTDTDTNKNNYTTNNFNSLTVVPSKYSSLSIIDSDYIIDYPNKNLCHNDISHFGSYTFGIGFHNMIGLKWSDIYT